MGEIDKIESHIERLVCLVRNATLRRVLHKIDPDPQLNFWRVSYGNLTDVAVIEWCKTFGEDSEDGHWKNVVSDPNSFRTEMLNQLKIDRGEWDAYWQQMKLYRNKVAVHASHSSKVTDYPCFDVALESAFFYFQPCNLSLMDREGYRFIALLLQLRDTHLLLVSGFLQRGSVRI